MIKDVLDSYRQYLRWHIIACQLLEANFHWIDTIDKVKNIYDFKAKD